MALYPSPDGYSRTSPLTQMAGYPPPLRTAPATNPRTYPSLISPTKQPQQQGATGVYDYRTDPGYQELQAYFQREKQAGGAQRDEQMRRRLIQLGSRDLASKILGSGDPILASISGDEAGTSEMSRVLKSYNDILRQVEEQTSMSNTFWGTGRAQGYQQAAYGRQQTEADLLGSAEQDIQGYQDAYDAMLRQLEEQRRAAEQEAWMNQMWNSLLAQYGTSGSDPTVVQQVAPAATTASATAAVPRLGLGGGRFPVAA